MIGLWSAIRLAVAIRAAFPDVPAERALPAAIAISAHRGDHDPMLVAAIFLGETAGLDPSAISPRTGACGIGQVLYSRDRAVQARRCRRIVGDVRRGTIAAIAKLDDAADFCLGRRSARRDRLGCTIAGYRGGPPNVRRWERSGRRAMAGVRAVIGRRDALRRAMGVRPGTWPRIGAGS